MYRRFTRFCLGFLAFCGLLLPVQAIEMSSMQVSLAIADTCTIETADPANAANTGIVVAPLAAQPLIPLVSCQLGTVYNVALAPTDPIASFAMARKQNAPSASVWTVTF